MFLSNNRVSFHLCWKKNLVKHQRVSKYYENDCLLLFYFLVLRERRYLGPTLRLHYRYTTDIVWERACWLIDLIAIVVIRNGKVQSLFLVTVILYIDQTIFKLVLPSRFRSSGKVIHKNFLPVSCSSENNFFWADNQQNCDARSNSALYILNGWLFFDW